MQLTEQHATTVVECASSATKKRSTLNRATELLIEVTCTSKSPLIMDLYEREQMVADLLRRQQRILNTDARLEDIAAAKIYRNAKGQPVLPTACLYACLRDTGKKIVVKGKEKISTKNETAVYAIVTSVDGGDPEEAEFIPLKFPERLNPLATSPSSGGEASNDPFSPWIVDVRQGRNKNTGGAACVVRPRFNKWAFTINMMVDLTIMDVLTEAHIRALFDKAGKRVGLLAYRNGPFGRFEISGWRTTPI
jgi:hypothetical protein